MNVISYLADSIDANVTTLSVIPGDGSKYPQNQPFHILVGMELMYCSSILVDTMTVGRGHDSTTPAAHTVNDPVTLVISDLHVTKMNQYMDELATDAELAAHAAIEATGSVLGHATPTQITKLNGIEAGADVTDAGNVDSAGAVMNSDTSVAAMGFKIDEDNMASNLDTKIPTQQSVKAYVDTEVGTRAKISTGNYTGNNAANRGIAHGLAVIPKIVFITLVDTVGGTIGTFQIQQGLAYVLYRYITYYGYLAVTAMDSTNFYVGNASFYDYSANSNVYTYYWTAIG
jgi:hypothetical protein